jgi:hypothetical protein
VISSVHGGISPRRSPHIIISFFLLPRYVAHCSRHSPFASSVQTPIQVTHSCEFDCAFLLINFTTGRSRLPLRGALRTHSTHLPRKSSFYVNLVCGSLPFRRNSLKGCTVKRFAQDVVGPKVREMDENESMDPAIIKGLFDQGVRNFTPTRYI